METNTWMHTLIILSFVYTYNNTSSLQYVVRTCFTHIVLRFIYTKQKTRRSSHTYTAKKNTCVQRGEDRWIFFFCPTSLCAISFSLFLLLFLRTFFFYSKINFPSSSTDGPVAVTSLSSHIFFCDFMLPERLCWRVIEKEKNNNEENFLQTTNNCCFFVITISYICFQNIQEDFINKK